MAIIRAFVAKKVSTLIIENWELGQIYWNCLKKSNNNEQQVIEKSEFNG